MARCKFVWAFFVGLVFVLTACAPIPERINFESDRRIFRGVYGGVGMSYPEAEDMPIRVEVTPQYIDRQGYTITGTVTLAEETAIPFEGEVSGGDTQVYVLTSPTLPPIFEAGFTYRGEKWTLGGTPTREDGFGPGQVPWYISFGPFVDEYTAPPYQATLEPVD